MKRLKTFIALMVTYLMIVAPVWADLTIDNKVVVSLGNKRMLIADVDFDSAYAFGGESFDYTALGFVRANTIKFISKGGYSFEYDYTNKKVKVFTKAPPIVYEEKKTIPSVAPYTVTLDYPAAYVMAVASATANYLMISGGSTPTTGMIAMDLKATTPGTRAVLTANAAQAAQTIYITYVTQAWQDVFNNLVVDEAHALTTTGNTLTYTPTAVMYVDNGTNTPLRMVYSADTPASGEVAISFSTKTLTPQAAATGKVTYIKNPTTGFLADRFVEEERFLMASGFGSTTWPVLIWGTAEGGEPLPLRRPFL